MRHEKYGSNLFVIISTNHIETSVIPLRKAVLKKLTALHTKEAFNGLSIRKPLNFFLQGFLKLIKWYDKYLNVLGKYVDKQRYVLFLMFHSIFWISYTTLTTYDRGNLFYDFPPYIIITSYFGGSYTISIVWKIEYISLQ